MLMKAEQSTLLLVDVQARLMPAISQGMEVVERCTLLATIAGLLEVPVIATEQVPDKLGPNVESVRELCHHTVSKYHFDACPDGLIDALPEGRQHIVIGGCETHVCMRSEEHTSELQSRPHLVCRLLLEKKQNLMFRTQLQDLHPRTSAPAVDLRRSA